MNFTQNIFFATQFIHDHGTPGKNHNFPKDLILNESKIFSTEFSLTSLPGAVLRIKKFSWLMRISRYSTYTGVCIHRKHNIIV